MPARFGGKRTKGDKHSIILEAPEPSCLGDGLGNGKGELADIKSRDLALLAHPAHFGVQNTLEKMSESGWEMQRFSSFASLGEE